MTLGGMREWPNRTVSKTVVGVRPPWVQIPLPPPVGRPLRVGDTANPLTATKLALHEAMGPFSRQGVTVTVTPAGHGATNEFPTGGRVAAPNRGEHAADRSRGSKWDNHGGAATHGPPVRRSRRWRLS